MRNTLRIFVLIALFTALHLTLSAVAMAQVVTASNGVVTLTPFRGSSAFVPGAAIAATFNDPAARNWHQGTNGYENQPALKYKYLVRAQPGNVPCYVWQVEPNRLSLFMGFATGATSISISLQDPANPIVGEGAILWTETISLVVARAAPVLTGAGQWYAFTDARLHEFGAGGFTLPRNGLRFDLALFASNLGGVDLWIVEIRNASGDVVFEALALTEWANQARPTNLMLIGFPQLPVGEYTVRAYALDDPGLISPPITLTVQ